MTSLCIPPLISPLCLCIPATKMARVRVGANWSVGSDLCQLAWFNKYLKKNRANLWALYKNWNYACKSKRHFRFYVALKIAHFIELSKLTQIRPYISVCSSPQSLNRPQHSLVAEDVREKTHSWNISCDINCVRFDYSARSTHIFNYLRSYLLRQTSSWPDR